MSDSQVEEIKNRLDVVEIVQEYLPSMRQAGGNWRALCPFHNEKTPSFMVSKEKQIWHCFGCSSGGDVFSFVMKMENIEFPEALKILAKRAGVVLRHEAPQLNNQKTKLLDILEEAAKFYHHFLLNSPEANGAREYLFNKRKLTEETVDEFYLGFAPDSWDGALKFLRSRGFNENDIFLAGLTVKKDRGAGFYDRFRARIMFPIRDVHGHIVGFTARLMPEAEKKENAGGKYVNTPQTLVYNKSQVIYGLDRAKQYIKKENLVVMVEGNMDVIASHQAGVKNVVASSGTAMTLEQVGLLKRFSPNLAISFDADLAGGAAAVRGIEVALREGMALKVIMLSPEIGKDPDDYIKKDPALWCEVIASATNFMDYFIKKIIGGLDLRKVEHKKEAARVLLGELVKIPDKVEQAYYLEKLTNILGVSEQVLREAMPRDKISQGEVSKRVMAAAPVANKNRSLLLAERLLAMLLKYPDNLGAAVDLLEPFMMPEAMVEKIYKNLILSYNRAVDKGNVELRIDEIVDKEEDRKYVDGLVLFGEAESVEATEEEIKNEIIRSAQMLRENYILGERKRVEREMKKAEEAGDKTRIKELEEEFSRLI